MSWIFSRTGADTSEFLELADRAEQVQASMIDSMPFFFYLQLSSLIFWIICAEPNPIGVLEVSWFFQAHEAASKMQERQGFRNRFDEPAGRAVWGLQGITEVSHAQKFLHIKTVVMVAGCWFLFLEVLNFTITSKSSFCDILCRFNAPRAIM